jgi:hypothetical protein
MRRVLDTLATQDFFQVTSYEHDVGLVWYKIIGKYISTFLVNKTERGKKSILQAF